MTGAGWNGALQNPPTYHDPATVQANLAASAKMSKIGKGRAKGKGKGAKGQGKGKGRGGAHRDGRPRSPGVPRPFENNEKPKITYKPNGATFVDRDSRVLHTHCWHFLNNRTCPFEAEGGSCSRPHLTREQVNAEAERLEAIRPPQDT